MKLGLGVRSEVLFVNVERQYSFALMGHSRNYHKRQKFISNSRRIKFGANDSITVGANDTFFLAQMICDMPFSANENLRTPGALTDGATSKFTDTADNAPLFNTNSTEFIIKIGVGIFDIDFER